MLNRLARSIAVIEDGLLVFLLAVMTGLAGSQVLLRNFWDTGIAWSDPLARVLVLWVALLGAMAATRNGGHISIDVLSRFLPPRAKDAAAVVTDLFAGGVCAVLAYHGARLAFMDWEVGVVAFAKIPAWVCELIIPLGFGVIAARFLLSSLRRAGQPPGTSP